MSKLEIRKAIVTGATGMIGSELVRHMVADGVEVFAVVRPNSKKLENLIQSELIRIVPCDLHQLDKLTESIDSADIFYHFAWD